VNGKKLGMVASAWHPSNCRKLEIEGFQPGQLAQKARPYFQINQVKKS
jgi:hypothetical protein